MYVCMSHLLEVNGLPPVKDENGHTFMFETCIQNKKNLESKQKHRYSQ